MDKNDKPIPSVREMMEERNGPDREWFEAVWTSAFVTIPEEIPASQYTAPGYSREYVVSGPKRNGRFVLYRITDRSETIAIGLSRRQANTLKRVLEWAW